MLKHHGRYTYSAIVDRPAFEWPNKTRLAVYIGLNLEHFSFGEGLGAELVPGNSQPDVLNFAWRDYGNRVGVWRLLELFDELQFPVGVLVNTSIYDYCPQVVSAFRRRGDEIIAHGHTNSTRQGDLNVDAETKLINEVTEVITSHEGAPPHGWLGPWISQSWSTPDLLQAAGYKYLLDWCHDDQPTWFQTTSGKILSIPYPQEINDVPAIVTRKNSAAEFAEMIVDNFDEMLEQSTQQPLVCGIALHPYLVGQPYRLRHLRKALQHISQEANKIWLTHPRDIANYYRKLF